MKPIFKYIPVLFLSLATLSTGAAQASDTSGSFFDQYILEITLGVALLVSVLVLVVLIVILTVLRTFVHEQELAKVKEAQEQGVEVEAPVKESFWSRIYKGLTDSVPVEKEEEVLTDHSYDGIKELDNNLPPWWVYMFYITIVFAVVYFGYYHVFNLGPTSAEEYEMEMAAAQEQIEAYRQTVAMSIDETNVEFTQEAAALAEGKEIFIAKCAACHANDGGGGVGPNLTDKYWIHGGDIKDLFRTVKVGVPQKGMISWQTQLTPVQMQNVSSYILTLQGTTPQNPKEPQGELYEPEEEIETEETATDSEDSDAITLNY